MKLISLFICCRKPEILKDRDLAGELKDVWSAVQNFREKEKAGISDIVVYTEFGPDSAPESLMKPVYQIESSNSTIQSENYETQKLDSSSEKSDSDDRKIPFKKEECEDSFKAEHALDTLHIDTDKLLIGDKKADEKQNENNQTNEKNVIIQNQKNKESQHHFFPKFLTSSKDKETKEMERVKEEQEPKNKTKKTLNFFRRNKSTLNSSNTVRDSPKKESNVMVKNG